MPSNSIKPIAARWPRILSEQLVPVPEPLTVALQPGREAPPRQVIQRAARALLHGAALEQGVPQSSWPEWLAPHQVPAAERLMTIVARHGGALLADAVGLGKSYVALAVAFARQEPFCLVVPAVLVSQWRDLLNRFGQHEVPIITHESLSQHPYRPLPSHTVPYRLFIVDEAHRFRNPDTNRYRALARLIVGARILLVSATPVHNHIADLFHLLRLFLRDHALAALGVPSLRRAARGDIDSTLAESAAARLVVARSRERIGAGYDGGPITLSFPRSIDSALRAGPLPDRVLGDLISGVGLLRAGGSAAPLLRLMLLRRLGSSARAFRAALLRHQAYLDLASAAAAEGRDLSPLEFQRCFPRRDDADLQLVLFPLLLEENPRGTGPLTADRAVVAELRAVLSRAPVTDPKADALAILLAQHPAKTIVFSDSQHTVRYLLQRFQRHRVAAVYGTSGRFAVGDGRRQEVLRAFAPRAQGSGQTPAIVETDLLIATDLLSEGLNLQDAARVVHYDLPWSPARLAQRTGRIDRLGSPHATIATVTFLPPPPLAKAVAIEARLATKIGAQHVAGANGRLDWCDRLAALAAPPNEHSTLGICAAVSGPEATTVLTVRIGALVEAIVVEKGVARAGPAAATRLLADAWSAAWLPVERGIVRQAIEAATPLIKSRLAALQDCRWRASDRDRLARRLIPWVLAAARRAARRGDGDQLSGLDSLVSRLALGMTAGEELLLDDLLSRREPLLVKDLLSWHAGLPPANGPDAQTTVELIAALQTRDATALACQ